MAGRRHEMDSTGESYEDFAAHQLGRIVSMIRVPGKKDFGIDFYFQLREQLTKHTETVTALGSIQIKGGREKLHLGGLNEKKEWSEHELIWLKSQTTPLFLAHVDKNHTTVDLFSIWPLWLIFWTQAVNPFKVVFSTAEVRTGLSEWQHPEHTLDEDGKGYGDGKCWTVFLGPPFLRLTNDELNSPDFRTNALQILQTWLEFDRLTIYRFQQFIPWLHGITSWHTNSLEKMKTINWQFWDRQPDANLSRLCQTVSPILVNLGTHLQWQNEMIAYDFLPLLKWINSRGLLDPMGQGLIENLERAKAKGGGPADDPSVSKVV